MRIKCMSKFTSIVLSLLMVISIMPQTAFASSSPTVWDGTTDTSWYDDTDISFTFTTAEQLAGLAELVNAGNDFSGKTITLGADIRLNDTTDWESWDSTPPANIWAPIGTSSATCFSGTFDGNGKTISGIYINTTADYQGLYGYVLSATVQNVGVIDNYIKGNRYVGGVVGFAEDSIITNCFNAGSVSGK